MMEATQPLGMVDHCSWLNGKTIIVETHSVLRVKGKPALHIRLATSATLPVVKGKEAQLTPWDADYVRHLAAEFNSLHAPSGKESTRIQEILTSFRTNPEQIKKQEILELELNLIAVEPPELVLQRAPRLRDLYREVVGANRYALYKPAELAPGQTPTDADFKKALVADLQNLMSDLFWHYTLEPHRDGLQRSLTRNVITCVVIYTAIWAACLSLFLLELHSRFIATMLTVVYAGILGGYVSSLQRVQTVPINADSMLVIHVLNNGRYFLWFAPLIGAVFAVVLTTIFMSGLIGGSLFPAFSWKESTDAAKFLYLLPATGQDYPKLFVWSFIAGFSERFVPDVLDRLLQRAREAEQTRPQAGKTGKTGDRQTVL